MAHLDSSSSLEELLQKVKERFQAGERGHLAQIGELNLYGQELDGKPKLCAYLRVEGVEYSGGGEGALARDLQLRIHGEAVRIREGKPTASAATDAAHLVEKHARREAPKVRVNGELSLAARRILYVFGWYGGDKQELDRVTLGVLSVYSYSSGNFNNALSELRTHDLLEPGETRGHFRLTPQGAARVQRLIREVKEDHHNAPGPWTHGRVRDEWEQKLSGTARKLFVALVQARLQGEGGLTRETLATRTGYSAGSGNFNNAVSELNGPGLIDKAGRGEGSTIRASKNLFTGGT